MASYTIEDIELLRRKSGISYQEAVALLDYHNGNVARALVDLERNGRIKPESSQDKSSGAGQKRDSRGLMNFLSRMYQFRIKVKKEQTVILNLSLLFTILTCLISPHLVVVGVILVLVLGYRISFDKRDPDFASANLEKMVRNAGENVRGTVNDFTRGFQEGFSDDTKKSGAAKEETRTAAQEPEQKKHEERSYYTARPASAPVQKEQEPLRRDVPTIQVPVQVESQDGHVTTQSHRDGYNSATVE